MYPYIAPENFENSKIVSITNDQLSIKITDLLEQNEIKQYCQSKEKLIPILQKYCEFFEFSEDKETIKYNLPEGMTVFSILNIPYKLNKEEVKNHIELINLQYNRLYKKGFYWILSTIDKETVICVQNSLRELIFDEIRIKYIHNNKNQILKSIKDKLEKNSYQKDVKYLGINSNNGGGYSKGNYNKGKGSDADSESFSWRKGSGGNKSSFDYGEKPYKKNNYYKYKRNRFNSDNDGKKYKNNNYYQNYGSYNNNNKNLNEIEIDISNLKYNLNIKYKYSFGDIKNYYEKHSKNENIERPQFINETLTDILSDKQKEIVSLDELIECNEKNKKSETSSANKNDSEKKTSNININNNNNNNNNINTNIKIPKMNPLSGMSKNFNKFDVIPGNAMPGLMMSLQSPPWIPESNQE